ncbi:MAG TPA: PBP1A family penicillin-binding protein [Vicinamibacterales bacterium]|nr:PBP1A family penicillin-binding protein [Vicinamibacterales bacterium]
MILLLALPLLAAISVTSYYYVTFARIVDARLQGERVRALPRVLARPFEIRRGQWLSAQQLADRLNDLGYAERETPGQPGEFSRSDDAVTLIARGGEFTGRRLLVRIAPQARGLPAPIGPDGKPVPTLAVSRVEVDGGDTLDRVELDRPLLTTLITTSREKRRRVSLSLIPKQMVQAVLAIEDRRFYDHPGIDPIRIVGAIVTNIRGDRPYLVGGSTLTQQLVKNFFLTPEKSYRRKLQEQFLSVVLETRATKDDILELYLNDVYLGQRGSYAIHGVAEASRVFFGKDVTNVSLAEAATIAGVIQAPGRHSPFSSPTRSRDRRNVVLQAMADAGFVSQAAAERAGREPMHTVARAMETEAAYFVDLVGQQLADQYPDLLTGTRSVDISTTLDAGLQRIAQEAVQHGAAAIDAQLARKKVKGRAQIALVALDPRTGDILAYIGGRSYGQSQFNRPLNARRQPGSVFKPFVYLAAFESAADDGLTDLTPATLVNDEQSMFDFENQGWTPRNYEDEYDGIITLRRALAQSRNVATVRVAELAGFGRVADLWKRFGSSMVPKPYPSIALGVFEATPMEVASAYTIFPNGGELRPLRAIARLESGGDELPMKAAAPARIARADATFLVTSMLRSVVNEGTAAAARGMGFSHDAAGKTGTTNDLRDAWFVGFTPELLAAVWVGFDDNQPVTLSGSQAALPIWTRFMMAALSGRPNAAFAPPPGIVFVAIDRDTGKLAQPGCPRVLREAFIAGTEPTEVCELHRF